MVEACSRLTCKGRFRTAGLFLQLNFLHSSFVASESRSCVSLDNTGENENLNCLLL